MAMMMMTTTTTTATWSVASASPSGEVVVPPDHECVPPCVATVMEVGAPLELGPVYGEETFSVNTTGVSTPWLRWHFGQGCSLPEPPKFCLALDAPPSTDTTPWLHWKFCLA